MNATEVIEATQAVGVVIRANGDKLVLEAKRAPPETQAHRQARETGTTEKVTGQRQQRRSGSGYGR